MQVSPPLLDIGDSVDFLKRRYVKTPEGIAVYSNGKYIESLRAALGSKIKARDAPADNSFLEHDTSKELNSNEARVYKESVGRLLYLAHSRPDIQFSVCVLSSKMSCPTTLSLKWLHRVVGYLLHTPEIGFLIKPIRDGANFFYSGGKTLEEHDGGPFKVMIESITDADWAGCKRTRRSRSSMQFFVAGSLVGSAVRTQKSIALSSAESEFIAMLGGACEGLYLRHCLEYLTKSEVEVVLNARSDSASARAIGQRLGCGRVRHLSAGWLWIQGAVKARELEISAILGAINPADLGTKPLGGARIRELLFTMNALGVGGEPYGQEEKEAVDQKRTLSQAIKDFKATGARVHNIKALVPLLIMLTQVNGVQAQGLGLAALATGPEVSVETVIEVVVTCTVCLVVAMIFLGLPYGAFRLLK